MGGHWKDEVETTYKEWKYNNLHKEIKTYFNEVQQTPLGEPFKRDSQPLIANLSNLKDDVTETVKEEKIVTKNADNCIDFLGKSIDIGEDDEEEVDSFCKETIFQGFWKTLTKLCNTVYLAIKSVGDVLKKLVKKLVDFFEAGAQKAVIAIGNVIAKIVAWANPLPEYEEHDETGVLCVKDLEFINYAETVNNVPGLTFFPKTVEEVQKVVLYAKAEGRRVRAAGMKHSWTEMFSNTGEILVYLLPLSATDTISYARADGLKGLENNLREWGSEMSGIEVVSELDGGSHAAVRIGAGTTNLEMMSWSLQSGWTLPIDIIAVMITYGGSNAMICHGAGIQTQTMSDLVLKMEFVNAKGELQVVEDPDTLKVVGGCFGLAGIVTHITLRLDRMTWAKFQPQKIPMENSIPRPGGDPDSPEFQRMVSLCRDSYYSEFFWFPNRGTDDGYWENCWKNDGLEEDALEINLQVDDHHQVASTFLFEVMMKILHPVTLITRAEHYDDKTSLQEVVRYLFNKVVSKMGHSVLPHLDEPMTTPLVEALHFRRGFHYIAVREMEMEIPIPSLEDGSPDWSIVSRVWWDAVDLIEKSERDGVFATDMTLEMRVMGGSDVVMAPQYGNKHGTLAVEPVSTRIVHKEVWEDFKEELAKVWMGYKDFDGTPLLSRVHWAKEWPRSVTVDSVKYDTMEYWQKIYQPNMERFFDTLDGLTEDISIQDIYDLYSNHHQDKLFGPQWERFGVKKRELEQAKFPPDGVSSNGNGVIINEGENENEVKASSSCCVLS